MATCTLSPRPHSTLRTRIESRPAPRANIATKLTPARLQEVEDQLLAAAIERHPGRERAITHLLNDIECPDAMRSIDRRSILAGDARLNHRMEDLLLEAIVRTHPNRTDAIDRLLGDVVGDAADMDDPDEQTELALFEMSIDNDCDGMG